MVETATTTPGGTKVTPIALTDCKVRHSNTSINSKLGVCEVDKHEQKPRNFLFSKDGVQGPAKETVINYHFHTPGKENEVQAIYSEIVTEVNSIPNRKKINFRNYEEPIDYKARDSSGVPLQTSAPLKNSSWRLEFNGEGKLNFCENIPLRSGTFDQLSAYFYYNCTPNNDAIIPRTTEQENARTLNTKDATMVKRDPESGKVLMSIRCPLDTNGIPVKETPDVTGKGKITAVIIDASGKTAPANDAAVNGVKAAYQEALTPPASPQELSMTQAQKSSVSPASNSLNQNQKSTVTPNAQQAR